jgi:hypothetical protein
VVEAGFYQIISNYFKNLLHYSSALGQKGKLCSLREMRVSGCKSTSAHFHAWWRTQAMKTPVKSVRIFTYPRPSVVAACQGTRG